MKRLLEEVKSLKRVVSGVMLILLLTGILTLAFNIQPVKTEWTGTVYIRADGSIDPPDAPIITYDNITYTLNDSIVSSADGIVVERDNIIIDGEGYTLQGQEDYYSKGIYLSGRNNVTVKNMEVKTFSYGIYLDSTFNNSILGNNITDNGRVCIMISNSSNITISGNSIANNDECGIFLSHSSNITISGNCMANNGHSITLEYSSTNSIYGNNITNSRLFGIRLSNSSNITISGNNVTNNKWHGVWFSDSSDNTLRYNHITGVGNFFVEGESLSDFINNIDSSNSVNGKPVYYWVNQQHRKVPADAGYVALVNSTNITVQNLNLKDNGQGLLLAYTRNSLVMSNCIEKNGWRGIHLHASFNNTISRNNITDNGKGIQLWGSSNNIISVNNITDNGDGITLLTSSNNTIFGNNITDNSSNGISLWYSSNYNIIFENNIANNRENGIMLSHSSNNNRIYKNNIVDSSYGGGIKLVYSLDNTVSENNIANNKYGIWLISSSNNTFYHNNLINNKKQVYDWSWDYLYDPSINAWDGGYPFGGNYWSNYSGTDAHYDGIGDTSYIIDESNVDRYPLMGPFSSFNTSLGYPLDIVSNSTVEDFEYFESNRTIIIYMAGATANQTNGFCRLTIHHELIAPPYNITINDNQVEYITIFENKTLSIIYFSYEHSTLEIVIIPEYPSIIMLLSLMAISFITISAKRKHKLN